MKKIIISFLLSFIVFVFIIPISVLAIAPGEVCDPATTNSCDKVGNDNYDCLPLQSNPNRYVCQESAFGGVFGRIEAPAPLKGLLSKDPSGAGGLGIFFTNLITLFYIISMVVLVFMIVWGAFDWITSEGDKEKLGGARSKIVNAIIGIMLLAAAFGIIRVLGQFTGFKFFVGQ